MSDRCDYCDANLRRERHADYCRKVEIEQREQLAARDATIARLEGELAVVRSHERDLIALRADLGVSGTRTHAEYERAEYWRDRFDKSPLADIRAKLAASEALVWELAKVVRNLMPWYFIRFDADDPDALVALAKVPKEGRHG